MQKPNARLKPAERVGIGNASTTLNVGLDLSGGNTGAGQVAMSRESSRRVDALVDDARHPRLAVIAIILRAVEPNRGLVLDLDLEDLCGLALSDGEEAGEERGCVFGLAGLAEGGLDDRVVARGEV